MNSETIQYPRYFVCNQDDGNKNFLYCRVDEPGGKVYSVFIDDTVTWRGNEQELIQYISRRNDIDIWREVLFSELVLMDKRK